MNLLQMVLHPFLSLVGSMLFGLVSAICAKKRGKNPYLWFFLGALFGLLGLFLLFFSPKPAHKGTTAEEGAIGEMRKTAARKEEFFWYYLDAQKAERGPFSFDVLKKAWLEGRLSPESYVWNPTLDQWKPLGVFLPTS